MRALYVPGGFDPDWKQTSEYCSLHVAEASTIPLGWRAGYPENIDFLQIYKRLDSSGWLVTDLAAIGRNPKLSPLFVHAAEEIKRMGKMRWSAPSYQASERVLNNIMPG